jgi:hypothetical protein
METANNVLRSLYGAIETEKRNLFPYTPHKEFTLSIAVTFVTDTGRESKPFVNYTFRRSINGDKYEYGVIEEQTKYLITKFGKTVQDAVYKYTDKSNRSIHSVYISHSNGCAAAMLISEQVFRKEVMGEQTK